MADACREEWLTRREVANLIRVSVATLERWARRGLGPPVRRVGPRLVRYRRGEVETWLLDICNRR